MSDAAGDFAGLTQARGGRARRRVAQGARPAREARALPPRGRHLRALPLAHRAARLAAMVVPDGGARRGRRSRRLRERRVRYHPECQHRFAIELARGRTRLVRVAPALVGAPDARSGTAPTVTSRSPGPRRSACARVRLRRPRARPRRARHVVLVGALAVRHARLARADAELERYYPGNVNSTAREIIRLWENRMIFSGLFLLGEVPFTDVIIHSTVLAPDGRRMSKSLGTGDRPDRADRRRTAPTRRATGC